MTHQNLLDTQPEQPDDGTSYSPSEKSAVMNKLITSVEVIKSNYATKEELAVLNGKLDVLASNLKAFEAESLRRFATKEDLAQAVYQLTWRMAAFGGLLLSAGFAFARYL